jgi:ATP-dependent Clp protease adaptor protein ClpS
MSKQRINGRDGQVAVKTQHKTRLKRPRLYKVLFHNDDYTPREFVTMLLRGVFSLGEGEAQQKMLYIHNNGQGVVGIFTFQIAETKVAQVTAASEQASFPLLCTMEPESDGDEA